jgi:hypothetical protein
MIILSCVDVRRSRGGRGPQRSGRRWSGMLEELLGRVAGFPRIEPRRRVRGSCWGCWLICRAKNCWTIAQHAGEASPDCMQHLISREVLDTDGVRDDLRDYVVEHLGDPHGVLVVDETGDVKKGSSTVGVGNREIHPQPATTRPDSITTRPATTPPGTDISSSPCSLLVTLATPPTPSPRLPVPPPRTPTPVTAVAVLTGFHPARRAMPWSASAFRPGSRTDPRSERPIAATRYA